MNVDMEKLRALLDILIEKDIAEFEHEDEQAKVRVVRGAKAPLMHAGMATAMVMPAGAPTGGAVAAVGASPQDDADSYELTSPFVGTFYRSPSPEAPSFVEVGSVVRQGQTLCIVEAMKLMNEIEAEHAGTIVEIYAQNGKAVEFGQKLFRIKKA